MSPRLAALFVFAAATVAISSNAQAQATCATVSCPNGSTCKYGSLLADETWSSGSKIIMIGDVTVPAGKTLTIEPGVTVTTSAYNADCMKAGGDTLRVELIVDGTLKAGVYAADGSADASKPVTFAAGQGSASWGGISLNANSTGSLFKNVDIQLATNCVTTTSTSSVTFDDSNIHGCSGIGLNVAGSTSSVTYRGSVLATSTTTPKARIYGNSSTGVQNYGALTLTNTEVSTNQSYGVYSAGNSQIVGSSIHDNSNYGVYWSNGLAAGNQTLSRNVIWRNYYGGLNTTLNTSGITQLVEHNTFDNNAIYTSTTYEIYTNFSGAGSMTLRDNIVGNTRYYAFYNASPSGTPVLKNNLVWKFYSNSSSYSYGGYNISGGGTNPVYCNPLYVGTGSAPFRITSNSPAIGADSAGGDIGALPYVADQTAQLMGVLRSDMTLTAAASPWSLAGDLIVAPGVTLTIEPGATVNVASNTDAMYCGQDWSKTEVTVQGTLKANGNTSGTPSIIKIQPTSLGSGYWSGITFDTMSVNNVMNYVDIGYGTNCVLTNASNLVLDNSQIHHCSQYGVYVAQTTSSLTFRSNPANQANAKIYSNSQYGIYNTGALTLASANVYSNAYGGVYSTGNSQLTGNDISYNGTSSGSSGVGVTFYGSLPNGNQNMSRNTVHHNYAGGLRLTSISSTTTDLIDHNTFDNDDTYTSTTYETYLDVGGGKVTFTNNNVTNGRYYGVYRGSTGGTLDIHHNNVWNNNGSSSSYNCGGNLSGSCGTGTVSCNPLYVKTDGTNYRLTENSPSRLADSSPTAADIGALPYLADPTIGLQGILRSDLVLTKAGGPYNLIGDFVVDSGVTLSIEPGTVINPSSTDSMICGRDTARAELDVKGTLSAPGTSTDKISFNPPGSSGYAGWWYGIYFENGSTGNSTANLDIGYGSYCLWTDASNLVVSNSQVHHCSADSVTVGLVTSSLTYTGSQATSQIRDSSGGYGINNMGALTLVNSTIANNYRGGVYSTGNSQLNGNEIRNNGAGGSSSGYGVYFYNALPNGNQSMSKNTVHHNYAGGVYTYVTTTGVTDLIEHNTFDNNDLYSSTSYEIYAYNGAGQTTIRDNIATNNDYYGIYLAAGTSYATVKFNDSWNNNGNNQSYNWGGYLSSTGGIGAQNCNPIFVATDGTNYRITENSPLRNADSQTPQKDIGALTYLADPTPQLMGYLHNDTYLAATGPDGKGAPWVMPGDLVVLPGVTLTLESGARIIPGTSDGMGCGQDITGTELIVQGSLVVTGTQAKRAVIGPNSVSANQWAGIRFEPTSTGNSVTYLDVYGGRTCVDVEAPGVVLNNTWVHHCYYDGVYVGAGSSLTMTGVAGTYGGNFSNAYKPSVGGPLLDSAVYSSTTGSSSYAGIRAVGDLTLSNTDVSSNYYANVVFSGKATLTNNRIHGTSYSTTGWGVQATISTNVTDLLQNNIIYSNVAGGVRLNSSGTPGTLTLDHNTIDQNSTYGIYISQSGGNASTFKVRNNIISQNGSYGIYYSGSYTPTYDYNDVWNHAYNNYQYCSQGSVSAANPGYYNTNPLYNYTTGQDYRLQPASPVRTRDDTTPTAGDLGALPYYTIPVATIAVSPANASVKAASTQNYSAQAYEGWSNFPINGLTYAWSIGSAGGGTINSSGVFSAGCTLGTYAKAIEATTGGVTGSTDVKLIPGNAATVAITPTSVTVDINQATTFSAKAKDSCGNDTTDAVTWQITDPTAGVIDANGVFTSSQTSGTFTNVVKASTASGAVNYATVTTRPGTLAAVQVTSPGTISTGGSGQYKAKGIDQYGNTVTITPTWSTDSCATALGAIDGSTGVYTAGSTAGSCPRNGTGAIVATSGTITGTAALTVAACTPTSITVSPSSGTVGVKGTLQFTATSPGCAVIPTWTVTGPAGADATISSSGLLTAGCVTGTYTVKASSGAVSGTATVTINSGTIASIAVSPTTASVAVGATQTFTATGKDSCNNNVTISTPTWAVVAGGGSINASGVFTAGNTLGTYTNTVSATSNGVSGFASVTVTAGPLASITVTPNPATVNINGTQQFTAAGADAAGNPVTITPTWSVVNATAGTISSSGLFTAKGTAGTFLGAVKATVGGVSGTADVKVNPGALASITLSPATATLQINNTQQFTATGKDAGGNTVPATFTWSVAASGGTIDQNGLFTAGNKTGTYTNTVTATSGSVSGTATVTVNPGPVASLTLSPTQATLAPGGTQTFTASGKDAAGNAVTVTPTWSVVAGGGTITSAGVFTAGTVAGTYSGTVKATSGSVTANADITVSAGALSRIVVAPSTATVAAHGTQTYTATGYDANNNVVSITPTWSVTNALAGTIDANSGAFTAGGKTGSYTGVIKATSGSVSGTASVTVTAGALASMTISPTTPTVVKGATQTFTVTGADADGNAVTPSGVTWSVLDPAAGSINSVSGLFTAGSTPATYNNVIQAQSGSVTATTGVIVAYPPPATLTVSPQNPTCTIGTTQQYTATGKDASGNTVPVTVTWSVTAPAAGTIDQNGLLTCSNAAGTYTGAIKATSGTITGTASIKVLPGPVAAINITPASATLVINGQQQFSATATDSAGNTVTGATITWAVTSGGGSITTAGLYTAAGTPGSATITATSGSVTQTATITVNAAPLQSITVSPATKSVAINGTAQFTATGTDTQGNTVPVNVTWSVINGGGTIDSSTGLFTAGTVPGSYTGTVKATSGSIFGTASVTVTAGPLATITVTPNPASVTINTTQQFTATGKDQAGNTVTFTPTWSVTGGGSINSSSGLFTAPATAGSVTVKATSGTISGTAAVTVVSAPLASISITPNPATVSINQTQQFTVSGKDTQGNTVNSPNVTWSVTAGGGTIDASGLFTAGATPGTYTNTVKADAGNGITATATVGVTAGPLTSISITPNPASLGINGKQQFTAVGKDSAGNTVPVSPTWSVVAGGGTISSTGLFTAGTAPGSYTDTVQATQGTVTGTATVVVNPGSVASIVVSPNPTTLTINGTATFTATGKDSAGNTVALTGPVTWSVVNGGGTINSSTGAFTAGLKAGTFNDTVKATSGAISGTATVTVNPGVIQSLAVLPGSTTLVYSGTQQFTVEGRDAGGNTVAVPGAVTWSVVAGGGFINSSTGLFTAGATAGTYTNTVKATSGSATGTATVVVNAAPLDHITISPDPATVTINNKVKFTATGYDANGNVVPAGVNWSVVNGGGTIDATGNFTAGLTAGAFNDTVKASAGSISATASVVVNPGAPASLTVSPAFTSLNINGVQQYQATAKDAGGNTVSATVTWAVVNGGGTIDPTSGLFTAGITAGNFVNTIRATAGTALGTASITIKAGAVAKLTVSPTQATVVARGTQFFTATASDSYGNTVVATPTWRVTTVAAGTINAANGLFTAGTVAGSYPAAVEASYNGITDTADVIVAPGTLDHITVTPNMANLKTDQQQTFTASGADADGNFVVITPLWSVVGGGGAINASTGVYTAGQVAGTFTNSVKATASGVSGFASVTISPPVPTRIAITPSNPTVPMNKDTTFSAKVYDERNLEIVGARITWSVTAGGGSINATTGVFHAGLVPGTFMNSVTATVPGLTAATSVTVPADYDMDGMPDNFEITYGLDNTNPADANEDWDGDKLTNVNEFKAKTSPKDRDSDDDGVIDGNEVKPDQDSDGDGLTNAVDPDSDNDGILDGTEMAVLGPDRDTDTGKHNLVLDVDPSTSTDPTSADTDGDGLPDGREDANKNGKVDTGETDPNRPDKLCPGGNECTDGQVCSNGVCVNPGTTAPPTDACNNSCTNGQTCNAETKACEGGEQQVQTSGCGCGTSGETPWATLGLMMALGLTLRRRRA